MKSFLIFSILGVMACGVDPETGTRGMAGTASSVVTVSRTTSDGTPVAQGIGATTQELSCTEFWDCEFCRNGTRRNVLHEVCNGIDTVIYADACGSECL
jgi:hypothetical protein